MLHQAFKVTPVDGTWFTVIKIKQNGTGHINTNAYWDSLFIMQPGAPEVGGRRAMALPVLLLGGPSILGGPKCPLSSCLLLKLLCNPDENII